MVPDSPSNPIIQVCYVTKSDDVWEGVAEIIAGGEGIWLAIGPVCPICGGPARECLKEITGYTRWAVDFFPLRIEQVLIVRLRCKKSMKTLSLLPHQLAPYRRYTVRTMLYLLALSHELVQEDGGSLGKVVAELPGDCNVTSWLLRGWIKLALHGFASAHHILVQEYDLDDVKTGEGMAEELACIETYCRKAAARGPPGIRRRLDGLVRWYASTVSRHLLGIPSQERR